MKYLFVDNFRGFTKTLLPIKAVNFFVGENSTGKTSILGLINLIKGTRFWFTQKFNTEEVEFGNFEDIVSVNSQNKSYFRIGFIEIGQAKKGGQRRRFRRIPTKLSKRRRTTSYFSIYLHWRHSTGNHWMEWRKNEPNACPFCVPMTFDDALKLGWVCDEEKFLWWKDPFRDGGISAFTLMYKNVNL